MKLRVAFPVFCVLCVLPLAAETSPDPAAVLRAISLRVENKSGAAVSTATIATADGYFLTKSSDTPKWADFRFLSADGAEVKAREVRRDPGLDLVLGQIIGRPKATAPRWGESKSVSMGQWLVGAKNSGVDARHGVMSAARRKIDGHGAGMGVFMEDASDKSGVRIVDVGTDSPAENAGLKKNDVLLSIGGEIIKVREQVKEVISRLQPGEEVEVSYRRAGKESKCVVRLASKTKIDSNWSGEDYANGGVSVRTDAFPEVLQHDIPLGAADMGGPLVNLFGHIIGINIARVDRITTFALPVECFWPEVQKWIAADRHPPKALVR
jgi:serine protease Do